MPCKISCNVKNFISKKENEIEMKKKEEATKKLSQIPLQMQRDC
jgi:hypothetical protein